MLQSTLHREGIETNHFKEA
jgi:hypothetical protein